MITSLLIVMMLNEVCNVLHPGERIGSCGICAHEHLIHNAYMSSKSSIEI